MSAHLLLQRAQTALETSSPQTRGLAFCGHTFLIGGEHVYFQLLDMELVAKQLTRIVFMEDMISRIRNGLLCDLMELNSDLVTLAHAESVVVCDCIFHRLHPARNEVNLLIRYATMVLKERIAPVDAFFDFLEDRPMIV